MPSSRSGRNATGFAAAYEYQANVPFSANAIAAAVLAHRPTEILRKRKYVEIPATSSSSRYSYTCPFPINNRRVSGNNAPDCIPPASGVPVPSYGFHHGTRRWIQSSAARCPSACEDLTVAGVDHRQASQQPRVRTAPRADWVWIKQPGEKAYPARPAERVWIKQPGPVEEVCEQRRCPRSRARQPCPATVYVP